MKNNKCIMTIIELIFSPLLFAMNHVLAIIIQAVLAICILASTGILVDYAAPRLLFHSMTPAKQLFINENSYILEQNGYRVTLILFCVLCYLYMRFICPMIRKMISLQKKVSTIPPLGNEYLGERRLQFNKEQISPRDRSRMKKMEKLKNAKEEALKKERFYEHAGMLITYTALIGIIYVAVGSKLEDYGYDDDLHAFMEDYRALCMEELKPETGIFYVTESPLSADGRYHVEMEANTVYVMYRGGKDAEMKSLRIPKELYHREDWTGVYTCQIKYTPNTKVVFYIHPIPLPEADPCYGYDQLTETQKLYYRLMTSEQLSQIYLNAENTDNGHSNVIPVYTGCPVTEEEFREVWNLYLTQNFEYSVLPYHYSQYATNRDSIIVTEPMPFLFYQGLRGYPTETHEIPMENLAEYYYDYQELLDGIASEFAEGEPDEELLKSIVEYVLQNTEPMSEETDTLTNKEPIIDGSGEHYYDTGYSVLHDGVGTSFGYARALYGLLKRAGFEVIPVIDRACNEAALIVHLDNPYIIDAYEMDITGETNPIAGLLEGDSLYYGYTTDEVENNYFY